MTITKGVIMAAFVVIEGIDGAGTTTQAQRLARKLQELGRESLLTCEPTDGPIGNMIRQVLRRRLVAPVGSDRFEPLDPATMTLLFTADRMDHLYTVVEPALARGIDVVCDRYYHSTIAYQGVGGDKDWVHEVNRRARRADLVFYLHLPVETALSRLGNRPVTEIYEKKEFLSQVAANYEALFAMEPNAVVLDGTQPIETVFEQILSHTLKFIGFSS